MATPPVHRQRPQAGHHQAVGAEHRRRRTHLVAVEARDQLAAAPGRGRRRDARTGAAQRRERPGHADLAAAQRGRAAVRPRQAEGQAAQGAASRARSARRAPVRAFAAAGRRHSGGGAGRLPRHRERRRRWRPRLQPRTGAGRARPKAGAARRRPPGHARRWPAGPSGTPTRSWSSVSSGDRAAAAAPARRAAELGLRAGVLESGDFPNLPPGRMVGFVGVYDSRSEAEQVARRLADEGVARAPYVRRIRGSGS